MRHAHYTLVNVADAAVGADGHTDPGTWIANAGYVILDLVGDDSMGREYASRQCPPPRHNSSGTPAPEQSPDRRLTGRWGYTGIGSRNMLFIMNHTTTRNCPSVGWDQLPAAGASNRVRAATGFAGASIGRGVALWSGARCLLPPDHEDVDAPRTGHMII